MHTQPSRSSLLEKSAGAGAPKSLADIWIVGGGPSLKGFDFESIRGAHVMCCNDAFRSLPWADSVVSIDRHWIRQRVKHLEDFAGRKYLCCRHGEAIPAISDAVELEFRTEPGLSLSWECVHGSTTGYAALNIAVLLGYRLVGLLGFDYAPTGHWHDEYDWDSSANSECARIRDVWRQWSASFDSTLPTLRERGVEVINFSPQSAIGAFQKRNLIEIGEHNVAASYV